MVVYCCTFMKNVIKNNALNVSKLIIGLLSIACCNTAFAQQNNIQLLAAYEGNPEAQFQLALSYSTQTPNSKLAAYWYKQAARQGMANAQYNLGHFYLQGIGVKQNTDETIKWWQQSAHQDYAPAQHNMGTAYFEGIGVEKNYILAEQWFMRCAKLKQNKLSLKQKHLHKRLPLSKTIKKLRCTSMPVQLAKLLLN